MSWLTEDGDVMYVRYLKSPEWQALRRDALNRAGNRCEACRRYVIPLEVHHLHYDTIGDESLDDVRVLCQRCHGRADRNRKREAAYESWARNRRNDGQDDSRDDFMDWWENR